MTKPGTDTALAAALALLEPLGPKVQAFAPLGALTTYRVGGPAAIRVTVETPADLDLVADSLKASGLPALVVGRGSNLLVADSGFFGVAVLLDTARFGWVHFDACNVDAGAAVALPALARRSVDAGLSGLEWAVGVPGSVGGAVRMNAGGHGADVARSLRNATVFDLNAKSGERIVRKEASDLDLGYRTSSVHTAEVVIEASFTLREGDPVAGRDRIAEIVRWRRANQPGGQNAGSVFQNPEGSSAGSLIEDAGLKGFRVGTASVSTKHANFIQADEGGSADDVARLIGMVRRRVLERFSVELRTEVKMIGFAEL